MTTAATVVHLTSQSRNGGTSITVEDDYQKTINFFDELLDVIGKNKEGLHLPQICVVGEQSSGKSSLLGSLHPHMSELFPVNSAMCTRIPIVARLKKTADGEQPRLEIAEVGPLQQSVPERFEWNDQDRERALKHLQRLQTTQGVTEARLTLFSPQVSDLILTDLPGLIYNQTGTQEPGLKESFEKLVRDRIEPESVLILTVAEGKKNIEGVQAISLAREYDQYRQRTIRVWTKCDVFDGPQNQQDLIRRIRESDGKRFGDHAVCCRKGENPEFSREEEARFFQETPEFRQLEHVSVQKLVEQRLPRILVDMIKKNIPKIREQIGEKLAETQGQLDKVGEAPLDPSEIFRKLQRHLKGSDPVWKKDVSVVEREFVSRIEGMSYDPAKFVQQHFKSTTDMHEHFQGHDTYEACLEEIIVQWTPEANAFAATLMTLFHKHLNKIDSFELISEELRNAFAPLFAAAETSCRKVLRTRVDLELSERKSFVPPSGLEGADPNIEHDQRLKIINLVNDAQSSMKSHFLANMHAVVNLLYSERATFLEEKIQKLREVCGESREITAHREELLDTKRRLSEALSRLTTSEF